MQQTFNGERYELGVRSMKTADELGHRFDRNPPHDPVRIGLFSEDSAYDHVGCILRWCSSCTGQALADVYAGTMPNGAPEDAFPVSVVAGPREPGRPNWYVCAACSSYGTFDSAERSTPRLKKTS